MRGISVALPEGWHVARRALTPDLAEPHEILSLGNERLVPQDGARCHHMPGRALDAIGAAGAFVSIQESRSTGPGLRRLPPRPRALALRGEPHSTWVCSSRRDLRDWWMPFGDGERRFAALAALGPRGGGELSSSRCSRSFGSPRGAPSAAGGSA